VICRDVDTMLSAYVDRELDVPTSLEMESHLAGCARCTAALDQVEALRAAMRSAALAYPLPDGLESRVRAALRRETRIRPARLQRAWRWSAVPAAAAAAAALAWLTVVHVGGPGSQRIVDELVSAHVRSLMVDHLVDVASSDQHTVRPWFSGKIDFAPPVGDYVASGFPLIGGRVDYIAGRPVAALAYRHQQHLINVFIAPDDEDRWRAGTVDSHGYHLVHWNDGGLSYWAISDLNARELQTLADLIRTPGLSNASRE